MAETRPRVVIPISGTGTWLITHDGHRWWNVPYTVWSPRGLPQACRHTLWGARRALRKLQKPPKPGVCESPYRDGEYLIHEEPTHG